MRDKNIKNKHDLNEHINHIKINIPHNDSIFNIQGLNFSEYTDFTNNIEASSSIDIFSKDISDTAQKTISEKVIFDDITTDNKVLYINNITFKNDVVFKNMNKNTIYIVNCEFEKSVSFNDIQNPANNPQELKKIQFLNCKVNTFFIRDTIINELNINSVHTINHFESHHASIYKGDIKVNFKTFFWHTLGRLQNVSFQNSIFESVVTFSKNNIYKRTHVIPAPKNDILEKCKFLSCTFKKTVIFTECELDKVSFHNSVFKKDENDIEKNETVFESATLTDCDFSQTEFHQKANFKYVKFKGNNIFEYTEFQKQGAFYGAEFKNPTFNNLILGNEAHLYFEGLNGYHDKETKETKKNRTQIDLFSFTNTVINGRLDFSEDTIKKLDLQGSSIIGTITRRDFRPKCANWETATLLKHEELKIDNLIRALEYKAIEKDLYNEHLKTQKNTWRNKLEQLSLFMSWLSNDHGQSWGRGICVTLFVWILSFSLFYFSPLLMGNLSYTDIFKSDLNFNSYVSLMIKYLSPTDYQMLADYIQNTPNKLLEWIVKVFGILIYLLGKALVPYGAFEVVQAFRKYNKID